MEYTTIIDSKDLEKSKLKLCQYLALLQLYLEQRFRIDKSPIEEERLMSLEEQGWVSQIGRIWILSSKGLGLFETQDDLFEAFYNTFPFETPSHRILRTKKIDTKLGRNTRLIFNRVTNKNRKIQEDVLNGLKAELTHRAATSGLEYMNNIEAWLRQGQWEKYDDAEEKSSTSMETEL